MVCKLTKSIYWLKQASDQWHHKFHQVILSFGFEMNVFDNCVYHKFSENKYILHETKKFLSRNFEMKDLGDSLFVLGIEILRERSQATLRLSQRSSIDKIIKRFGVRDGKPGDTPVAKGDKFSLYHCPKGNIVVQEM